DHLHPRHPPTGRPGHHRRRRTMLGPRARRVRRHHHLRRQPPRHHPNHATSGLPRPGNRPTGRDRTQPHPAHRLGHHPHRPPQQVHHHPITATLLDPPLIVNLGSFRLTAPTHITAGEVVALLGPNGAGKTTALRALAGLQPLTTGHIRLAGVEGF